MPEKRQKEMPLARKSIFLIALLLAACCGHQGGKAYGQQSKSTSDSANFEVLLKLYKEFQNKHAEKLMLDRTLQSLNEVDSVYLVHYPTWIVEDEDTRQRILKAFRNRQKAAPPHGVIHIVTNPSRDEIVQITILGASMMGRGEVRLYISESLQRTILHTATPHSEISDLPEEFRKSKLPGAPPKDISFEASLFGGSLRFANGWGAEVKVGDDNLGYPFWSSGSIDYFLLLDRLKLGAVAPINTGLTEPDILGPVTISARRLNGAAGFTAEFDQPIGSGMLVARFSSGTLTKHNPDEQLTDTSQAYYLHTTAQLAYGYTFSFENGEYIFTVNGGVGFHQVGKGVVQSDETIITTEKSNFFSPIVKLDYIRHGKQMYGMGIQYYSSIVMVTAWTELFKDFFYVDLKYSTAVFRPAEPWEQPYFFMVSPRLRFTF